MKQIFFLSWSILLTSLCFSQTLTFRSGNGQNLCYTDGVVVNSTVPPNVPTGAGRVRLYLSRIALDGTIDQYADITNGQPTRWKLYDDKNLQSIAAHGFGTGLNYQNGTGTYIPKYEFWTQPSGPGVGSFISAVFPTNVSIFVSFKEPDFWINRDNNTLSLPNPKISNVLSCEGLKIHADCAGTSMSVSVQEVDPSSLASIGTELYKTMTSQEIADLKDVSTQFDVKQFCTTEVGGNTITMTDGKMYRIKLINTNGQWLEVIKFVKYKTGNFDLYMRDNPQDVGFESEDPYPNIYSSPFLWNKLGSSTFTYNEIHENIDYSPTQYNRAYVKIHNQGCISSTPSQLHLYWTRARLDEEWEKFWKYDMTNNSIYDINTFNYYPGGSEITISDKDDYSSSSSSMLIPAIAANTTYALETDFGSGKEWKAPNPSWYSSDGWKMTSGPNQGVQRPVVCMLARLTNTTDPISFSSSSTPIDPYVRKNNNVVTRNSALVNNPAFFVVNPGGGGWNHGWNTVMPNNPRGANHVINLRLDLLDDETDAGAEFGDFGEILIGLDSCTWMHWVSAGSIGTGIETVSNGILRVTDFDSAVIKNIPIAAADSLKNFLMGVKFCFDSNALAPPSMYQYAYQISQVYTSLNGEHGSNAVLYTNVLPAGASSAPENTSIEPWKSDASDQIQVYPNPLTGNAIANVTVTNEDIYTIVIKDQMGRQVAVLCDGCLLSEGVHHFGIDASKLSPGIYFASISSNTIRSTVKIIKQE